MIQHPPIAKHLHISLSAVLCIYVKILILSEEKSYVRLQYGPYTTIKWNYKSILVTKEQTMRFVLINIYYH